MEGFVIKYTDINNLLWEYKSKLEGLISWKRVKEV